MARNYSIELLPQQQQKTDAEFFVDALIPTYERQNKQIDQNYNNTIEQARQAYEADPGVERLENWKAVIKFAADTLETAQKTKTAYAAGKAKKAARGREDFKNIFDAKGRQAADELAKEFAVTKKGILKDEGEYLKRLEELKQADRFNDDQYNFLKKNSPGNQLRMREVLGYERALSAPAAFDIALQTDQKLQKDMGAVGDDPAGQLRVREQWYDEYIAVTNVSDPFYASVIQPEKERYLKSKNVNYKVNARNTVLSEANANFAGSLEQVIKAPVTDASSGTLGSILQTRVNDIIAEKGFEDIEGGLTANQQGVEVLTKDLSRIIKSKAWSNDDIAKLMDSTVLNDGAEGGTSTFADLYLKSDHGKEQYNLLVAAHDERQLADYKFEQGQAAMALESAAAKISSGELEPEEIKQAKQEALLLAKSRGLENTEAYKRLQNLDPTVQDREHYIKIRKEYQAYYDGNKQGQAFLNTEEINAIPNGRVRKELQELAAAQKAFLEKNLLPTTIAGWKTRSRALIVNSEAQRSAKIFQPLGGTLSGEAEKIQMELIQSELRALELGRQAFPKDDVSALQQAETLFNQEQERNGFNVIDQEGAVGAGKWSATIDGKYEIYKRQSTIRGEKLDLGIKSEIQGWDQDVENWKKDPTKPLLTIEQIDGAFIRDGEEVDSPFKLEFSKETIYKAHQVKKSPSRLSLEDLDKFLADPNNKTYINKFGGPTAWDQKRKILENSPELKLEDIVKKIGDKDLSNILDDGLHEVTPLRLERFWNALTKFDREEAVRMEATPDLPVNYKRDELRWTIRSQVPELVNASDEELDAYIEKEKLNRLKDQGFIPQQVGDVTNQLANIS